ncbi:MAG: AAA family ATPase [Thaumarchaeota archaeon]|nr:AAA family ATPase [Nitrososphaerota archaeon]
MSMKSDALSEHFIKTGIEGLDEFVKGFSRGGLIVISGSPGTGKTAMAASFIYEGALRYGEPGVYVSLIEDERRFYSYMRGFGYNFEKLKDKGLFRYLELPTLLSPAIGSLTNTIIEEVEKVNAKRLVIDSYTALNDMFKSKAEARTFLHTFLSKIVKSLGCTTLLIREETYAREKREYGFEEFLADGIIHLKASRLEGRLIRELTILKMRGNRIENPDACFTLHQGFKILPPTRITIPEKPVSFKPPPDPAGGYTSGIPDLDRIIGGFPNRSTILLEVDPRITPLELLFIESPGIASCIHKELPCICIPPSGTISEDLKNFIKVYGLSDRQIEEYLKLPLEEVEVPASMIAVKASSERMNQIFERLKEYVSAIAREYRKPPIRLIGVDKLAQIFGERLVDVVYQGVDNMKKYGGLLIWTLKPTYPWISERLAPLADVHLRITRRHGCMLIYGNKPRTPLYAIRFEEGKMPPKLIPIM